jgi:hypothetical protein
MTRLPGFAILLALTAGVGLSGEQKEPLRAAPKGVLKGGGLPKAGPRMTNPRNLAGRLYAAPPEQRERVLERLPRAQQQRARRELAWFDSLPREQQKIVLRRAERLQSLSPERKLELEISWRSFQQLPPGRRQPIHAVLRRLQMMPENRRALFLNSVQFKNRFTPEEQKIILDLSEIMVPPQ